MVTEENINRFLEVLESVTKIFASIEYCREDPSLTKYDLFALDVIYNQKGIIMSQLAKKLIVGMSTATGIIDKLVNKNLVERRRNHDDRRLVKLMLNTRGNEIAISHQNRKAEIVRQTLKLLSLKDQESLISILEKLSRKIRQK